MQSSQQSPELLRPVPPDNPPRFSPTDNAVEWIQHLVRRVRAHVTLHISQRFERMVCKECGSSAPQGGRIAHFIGCTIGAWADCLEHIGDLPSEVEDLKRPRSFTRAQERDLSALMFEARSLARSRILTRIPGAELCEECLQPVTQDSEVGHTAECRAGRVFARLSHLCVESAPTPGRGTSPAAGEIVSYGEPWTVEGNAHDEWPVRLRDHNGRLVLELRDSEVGDAVEEAYARRIVLGMNFLAGFPDKSLIEVMEEYGPGSYWISAVQRSAVGEALLATVKRVVTENLPRPTVSQAPLSPGDAAADRGTGNPAVEKAHGPVAAESTPHASEKEITAHEDANGEPCAMCTHAVLDHDDEFGNCTALPNPYGMSQRDGCDCTGYRTAEERAEEGRHVAEAKAAASAEIVSMPDPDAHLGACEADGVRVGLHSVSLHCSTRDHLLCVNPFCQCPCHDPAAERAA